ncbi:MAG: hypothetical protein D6820_17240, partial [Lentisphaerae bacterium]
MARKLLLMTLWTAAIIHCIAETPKKEAKVEPQAFERLLKRHDMIFDQIPERWEVAPFSGNGKVGFMFYRQKTQPENVISIHVGRHDYYDHREPYQGRQWLWVYRGRLPLGHFNLTARGKITGVKLRLNLWNATLTGTVTTSRGQFHIEALTHAVLDVISFKIQPEGNEEVKITWHPEAPMPPVYESLQKKKSHRSKYWEMMAHVPMPMP